MKILLAAVAMFVTWLVAQVQPIAPVACQTSTFDGQGYGSYDQCYTGK